MDGGCVRIIVTDEMHANAQPAKGRIVERREVESTVAAGHEHIRRTVVRVCGTHGSVPGRHAEDDVTRSRVQRVAYEAATLRPPRVLDACAQITRQQRRNLVLEAFATLVRERQVVRVGAYTQRRAGRPPCARRPCNAGDGGRANRGQDDGPLHSSLCTVLPSYRWERGSDSTKVDPVPTALSTLISPCMARARSRLMARPRPVPSCRRVRPG